MKEIDTKSSTGIFSSSILDCNENIDIDISDMAAKTEYNYHDVDLKFINRNNIFPIGLDVGYSATKVYSLNGYHKFPSLVKSLQIWEVDDIKFKKNSFIMYRDTDVTNKHWMVGEIVAETAANTISNNEDSLFSDNRIGSQENLVLNRVGIALGLLTSKYTYKKNSEIKIAVGLPEKFADLEEPYIEQLKGYHKYEIQLGNSEWIPISFNIEEDDIDVLSQPYGTLLSIATDRHGRIVNKKLLEDARALIYDAGYGTIDPFVLENGVISNKDSTTWTDMAMKAIHERLIYTCKKATGRTLSLQQINYLLSQPEDKRFVKYSLGNKWFIDPELNSSIKEVAKDNVRMLIQKYRGFNDIDIIIMTGGTSKVFYPYFKTQIPNIDITIAEVTDSENPEENFDCVFANSVGFFNYVVMKYRVENNIPETSVTYNEAAAAENN